MTQKKSFFGDNEGSSPRYLVDQIIRADNVYTDKADRKEILQLWPELKDQMRWWILLLQMCNKKMYTPNIDEKAPVWAIPIWSDAAGVTWTWSRLRDFPIVLGLCSLGHENKCWETV